MNETDIIPADWVLIEAARRGNWPCSSHLNPALAIDELRKDYTAGGGFSHTFRALCDMIAKYEQPPVDPDVEVVKRIIAAWYGGELHMPFAPDAQFARAVAQYKQERAK